MKPSAPTIIFSVTFILMCLGSAQAQQIEKPCTDDSRECMIHVANLYLESVALHDKSRVPFAPHVMRTEQGKVTGWNATELRSNQAKQSDDISLGDTRFYVDEEQHNVIYYSLLHISAADAKTNLGPYPRPKTPTTVHLAERIKVEHGLITEIEAIYYIETGAREAQSGRHEPEVSQGK